MKRDIAADRKMCEAATPGPWKWSEDKWHGGYSGIEGPVVDGHCLEVLYAAHCNEGDDGAAWFEDSPNEDDRKFIAEARTALPYYLTRCGELEATLEAAIANLAVSGICPPEAAVSGNSCLDRGDRCAECWGDYLTEQGKEARKA